VENNKVMLSTLAPGNVTVAAPWTSPEIKVQGFGEANSGRSPLGSFSLDLTFTGAARTLAATITCSNGTTFVAPEGITPIFSGKSAGHCLASFSLPICRAFKITLTATTDTCAVTECIVAMA